MRGDDDPPADPAVRCARCDQSMGRRRGDEGNESDKSKRRQIIGSCKSFTGRKFVIP